MFQTRSKPVPNPFQAVRGEYIQAMVEGVDHANPDEQFEFDLAQMTADQLNRVGRVYLAMAALKRSYEAEKLGKQSYEAETFGVTSGNPLQEGDLAA